MKEKAPEPSIASAREIVTQAGSALRSDAELHQTVGPCSDGGEAFMSNLRPFSFTYQSIKQPIETSR